MTDPASDRNAPPTLPPPEGRNADDTPLGDRGALERLTLRLAGVMRRHYERSAVAHGLTPPQATALRHLDAPAPMRTLAERMRCDASYVTALADALERHGWAERSPDPDDRRVRQLVLTPAGRSKRAAFLRTLVDDSPLARALETEERSRFGAMLERILEVDAARPEERPEGCPDDRADGACSPPPACDRG